MTTTRYETPDLLETQFEPGSDEQVLRNLRGISDRHAMELAETVELLRTTDELLDSFSAEQRITAHDICQMHRLWLESIYEWAGSYRQVMMSKDGFPFASPLYIPVLMTEFEEKVLRRYTPCRFDGTDEIAMAMAEVHTELLLIHPFREGNGRLARLLTTIMALQAGLPLLDYTLMDEQRERYFAAVRAGLDRNYEPMKMIFAEIIGR